jgi:hypothetical protein
MEIEFKTSIDIALNYPYLLNFEKPALLLNLSKSLEQSIMETKTVSLPSSNIQSSTDDIFSLQAKITTQQSLIKRLKKDNSSTTILTTENNKLTELRTQLAQLEKLATSTTEIFNRKGFDELILRKMYVVPSFEIHNGPAGLFDVSNISLIITYLVTEIVNLLFEPKIVWTTRLCIKSEYVKYLASAFCARRKYA